MAPYSHNKTRSSIVICPERFFTAFVVLYPVVSVSRKPSFFHFVQFLFLQEWKALTSNRENITAKLPRV